MISPAGLSVTDADVEASFRDHPVAQWLVLAVTTGILWTLIQLAVSDSTAVALLSGGAFGAVFATVFVLVRRADH
ncbi:hypothetical protein [Halorhabdus sp. CUG00001]|uniref:hypothetical protein n=1 Tax=Halorhabdus sp. CUG00001 TaxID=2600297 RepID=UPI00131C4A8A|nr:hypothetical protein [Halorhabdus sp. CUG00001]